MIKRPILLGGAKTVTPANMSEALQQAIEIEIATIPTYLYTYYSINRTPDQPTIEADLLQRLLKTGMPTEDAEPLSKEMSAIIMVFANKAGATVMSVVVEEMLHMGLASNVKQAICGMPDLIGKSPAELPAYLAGHEPPFPINFAKFSLDQLYTFLQIESPNELKGDDDLSMAIEYTTIGQFYQMIIDCVEKDYTNPDQYDTKAPQLVPGKSFYAPNNINTNYYNKEHRPQAMNASDSGDLIFVKDSTSAVAAMEEIIHQGEGRPGGMALGSKDCVVCPVESKPGDYDDPKLQELAHFDKFNMLYCELQMLEKYFSETLQDPSFDVKSLFVYDVPLNPVTADYPQSLQDYSNLVNAVYTYIFVMVEACYRHSGNSQYEIFTFGIHKSMMWILSSLCGDMPSRRYVDSNGVERNAAPTFANWQFNADSSPKDQVIALFNKAVLTDDSIEYIRQRIYDLPNIPLAPYQKAEPWKPILD